MSQVGKNLKTLKRRLEFLEEKIQTGSDSEKAMTYVKAERTALKWVLDVVEILVKTGRLNEKDEV